MKRSMTILAVMLAAGSANAQPHDHDHAHAAAPPDAGVCANDPSVTPASRSISSMGGHVRDALGVSCTGADKTLPKPVSDMLGTKEMRESHYQWHLVRSSWKDLDKKTKDKLKAEGWEPPRMAGEPGSGVDFLCMHHQMIQHVNEALADSGDACYKEVKGWKTIPWSPNPTWPMPWVPAPAETAYYRKEVANKFSKDSWIKEVSLDEMGLELENGIQGIGGIHGWMHRHWSGKEPVDVMACASGGPNCDWLGHHYTAHVNPIFWKLHGWIDDRMVQWGKLHPDVDLNQVCAKAFNGPMHHHGPRGPVGSAPDDFKALVGDHVVP